MKIISTTILVLLLVTIVVPVGYLAWRADQPMELPQFKGYTYYQYLNWRKNTLHKMAVEYQISHPNAKMGGGLDMCYWVDTTSWLITLPQTGFYTLAGVFPNLVKYVTLPDRKYIPKDVTILTFLPDWWKTYEQSIWYLASTTIEGPVAYCRLNGTPPVSAFNIQTFLIDK
jgi:hypothetical protein